jgi:hypothetical protein
VYVDSGSIFQLGCTPNTVRTQLNSTSMFEQMRVNS